MVITIALMVAASIAVVAPTAQAAPAACPTPSHNVNGDGYGVMNGSFNLKVGPYADCGNVARLSTGTGVWLWCWVQNSYGNYWWWVRVEGTSTYGWMSEDNMNLSFWDDDGDGVIEAWSRC